MKCLLDIQVEKDVENIRLEFMGEVGTGNVDLVFLSSEIVTETVEIVALGSISEKLTNTGGKKKVGR